MRKMKFTTQMFALLTANFALCIASANAVTIKSPNRKFSANIVAQDGELLYDFARGKRVLLDQSPITLALNKEKLTWEIVSDNEQRVEDSFQMITGERKDVSLRYTESRMEVRGATASGKEIDGDLIFRLYDNTLAYRLVLDVDGNATLNESSDFHFPTEGGSYYTPNGEFIPHGPLDISKLTNGNGYNTPILYSTDDYVLGIHESDLHNYPQLNVGRNADNKLAIRSIEAKVSGTVELPWRVIFAGDEIADLHNSKPVYLSLSKPAEGDFSWVKPGKTTWDWRVKGTTFNGVKYEMTTSSLKRYIDFCARHNIEYFLIDDEWYPHSTPLVPVEGLDLKEVIRYGLDKGVGMLVYYDLKYMRFTKEGTELDFDDVARTLQSWGAKGIKFGFLGSQGTKYTPQEKVRRTEEIIKIAAKHKLIVDFHDNPVPFGGLERQYPNYISREYCHAQMDGRRSFTPSTFVKIACINLLAGPIDQTNGTYSLNTIKERSKGPKNEYYSTVSAETARTFITHTGNMSVLLDAPEAYEQKSDIFEFISRLPSQWDETRYLEMDYGNLISVARRTGTTWFVGTVYGDKGGEHTIKLDFLDRGKSYKATIYTDAEDTNYMTNKESYSIATKIVKRGETLTTTVVDGGGYSLLIEEL